MRRLGETRSLLLTLRGTPFLYAGEEFGLEDADVPLAMRQDPAGRRDGCRAPIPWTAGASHGWTRPDNWLPFPPEADRRNAESMRADPASIAHLYHQILQLRRESAALSGGSMTLFDGPESLVVWERRDGDERFVIVVNMTTEAVYSSTSMGRGLWSSTVRLAMEHMEYSTAS